MGHYNFKQDLKEAWEVEIQALEKIKQHFPTLQNLDICPAHFCDILGYYESGELITFEVKNELMVKKTGNVAIEFTCRGKDTGIATTEATYWVEKIRGQFYLITTAKLKDLMFRGQYNKIMSGGDPGSNTKFYLIEEATFISWCTKL